MKFAVSLTFLTFLLLVSGTSCSRKNVALRKDGATPTNGCPNPIQVTLERTSASTPFQNQSIPFQVKASGCSGQFKVPPEETVFVSGAPYIFSKTFTAVGPATVTVVVQDANFPDEIGTASVDLTIVAPPVFGCVATFNPLVATLNEAWVAPVALAVQPFGAGASRVTAIRYASGAGAALSPTTSRTDSRCGQPHSGD